MAAETVTLDTTGMHCQSCAMLIEMSVKELEGVSDARVDLADARTEVTFDGDKVSVDDIVQEIARAGYGASVAS